MPKDWWESKQIAYNHTEEDPAQLEDLEIDLLLQAIHQRYGFDFRSYMRSSLRRRIRSRMMSDQLPTITSLLNRVLHEEGYWQKLVEDFSIQVTELFRDPTFFLMLRNKVIPELQGLPELRIWHAGCATGEEVYSLAILLKEEGLLDRAQIYATDMSKQAIEQAKQGRIPLGRMQAYTKNYLQAGGTNEFSTYYTTDDSYAYFHEDLKRHMMFAQHNLATDESFNEFHLILCRNVLIYFNSDLQQRVHGILMGSLTPQGFLALGSKESFLSSYKTAYAEFASEERIFRKLPT